MENVHPLYKIIAVLCVGSVAKALFAPARPMSTVTNHVARRTGDLVADAAESAIKKK